MDIDAKIESIAAMLADELEEMVVEQVEHGDFSDGMPLRQRKELVELIARRFAFFYAEGVNAARPAQDPTP